MSVFPCGFVWLRYLYYHTGCRCQCFYCCLLSSFFHERNRFFRKEYRRKFTSQVQESIPILRNQIRCIKWRNYRNSCNQCSIILYSPPSFSSNNGSTSSFLVIMVVCCLFVVVCLLLFVCVVVTNLFTASIFELCNSLRFLSS